MNTCSMFLGGSINPTRSFGPSVVAQWSGYEGTYAHQQYMFWFAPLFGAFLMATIYGNDFVNIWNCCMVLFTFNVMAFVVVGTQSILH